jgi:hypothetical protein
MWKFLASLFTFGTNDPLFAIRKAVRIASILVLANNPQFAIPVSAAMTTVRILIKDKSPAAAVKSALDMAIAELAVKASDNPLIQGEIKDLSTLINVKVDGTYTESGKLEVLNQIIDAIEVGVKSAK